MKASQNRTVFLASVLSVFGIISLCSSFSFAACSFYADTEKKISNSDPNRISCLTAAHFILPVPPQKTIEQIVAGPKSDESKISAHDTIYCRYFYRYQNGSSNKFRCYRTTDQNVLVDEKGNEINQAVGVSDIKVGTKLEEDVLIDTSGQPISEIGKNGTQKLLRADILKVRFKYSNAGKAAMSALAEWRHREAFTSSVASRLAWIMGIPSENYYPTKEVVCFGCDIDPWQNGLKPQLAPVNQTNVFPAASIERKFDGKRIIKAYTSNPKLAKSFTNVPWTWYEYMANFKKLTAKQKHEIQVLALFINLMHTVEERGSQHVLLCEKSQISADKKICSEPLAGTHDLGSAFGNRAGAFVQNGNHPRGDFKAYKALTMFRDDACTLTAQPGRPAEVKGDGMLKKVSEAARIDFVSRLSLVSKSDLNTILRISNFQDVDLPFKFETSKKLGLIDTQLNEKVLELWTDLIYSKMEQFKNVQCPDQAVVQ